MADNRIAFGLCEQHNIKLPKDATPHDAWEALKERGIVAGDISGILQRVQIHWYQNSDGTNEGAKIIAKRS